MFIGKKQIRLHIHGICLDFKVFHACSQAFQLKRASRSLAKTGLCWRAFGVFFGSFSEVFVWFGFRSVLVASWARFGRPRKPQNAPKIELRGLSKRVLHFASVLETFLVAFQEARDLQNEVFAWEGCNF